MSNTLAVGSVLAPQYMQLSLQGSHCVLPYKAASGGLVHRVYRYETWIGADCVPWACVSFTVLTDATALTCFWCIANGVHCGR